MSSYLQTMTTMLSEAKGSIHEYHIIEYTQLCKEICQTMIEELTPNIVKHTLLDTYMELYIKIRMLLDGKEVSFKEINDYIMNEIRENLIKSLKDL